MKKQMLMILILIVGMFNLMLSTITTISTLRTRKEINTKILGIPGYKEIQEMEKQTYHEIARRMIEEWEKSKGG